MAGGMLRGAVLLQVGFMAYSVRNSAGMMADFFDGGSSGGDTGVLGGRDTNWVSVLPLSSIRTT